MEFVNAATKTRESYVAAIKNYESTIGLIGERPTRWSRLKLKLSDYWYGRRNGELLIQATAQKDDLVRDYAKYLAQPRDTIGETLAPAEAPELVQITDGRESDTSEPPHD